MVGVGGDELTAVGPDLATGVPVFIAAGPAKSGRSTVLVAMARSLLASGAQLVLVTPRPSPLRSLATTPGVIRSFDGPGLGAAEFAGAVAEFTGPGVVIIDDAEQHRDCDAESELSKLINFGADAGLGLVIGGDAEALSGGFGGWHVEARRARRGCLIAPQSLPEGDLIGVRLPRSVTGEPGTSRPGPAQRRGREPGDRDRPQRLIRIRSRAAGAARHCYRRVRCAFCWACRRAARAAATARLRNITAKTQLTMAQASMRTRKTRAMACALAAKATTAPASMTKAAIRVARLRA